MKIIELLNRMADDDNFRPVVINFYNDMFIWNDLYKDWLNINGKGLMEYNFPNTLNNEVEILNEVIPKAIQTIYE